MPDSTAGRTRGPHGGLAKQAEMLRTNTAGRLRSRSQYTPLQKLLVGFVLLFSLAAATFLLISEASRQRLLSQAGAEWVRLYQDERAGGVFELPPPPPRRVEPRVVFRSSEPIVEPEGTIYTASPDAGGETVEKKFIAPQLTPGFEAAFRLLSSESDTASRLVNGGFPNLRYREWKPLQNKHPEYYVSLLAEDVNTGTEVQFIWSVNTESSQIVPLSQAARDLERTP